MKENKEVPDFIAFIQIDNEFIDMNNISWDINPTFPVKAINFGIEVFISNFSSMSSIHINLCNIKVNTLIPSDLRDVNVNLRFLYFNSTYFEGIEYESTLSILYNTNLGYSFSGASIHKFRNTSTVNELTYKRTEVKNFGLILIGLLQLILLIDIFFLIDHKIKRRLPIATLCIVTLTIFIYVFIGSFFEAKNNGLFIYPLGVFFHGYNDHIIFNLIYFTMVSCLFESWLLLRENKKQQILFFIFLLTPRLLGYGLSLSIEALTWLLWAYIVNNHSYLIKTKLDMLLGIISGLSSKVFVEWTIYSALSYEHYTLYDKETALVHIVGGIIFAIAVLILYKKGDWLKLER